jgi:hypothetical protein
MLKLIWWVVTGLFRSRASLEAEIVALRHQLNVLRRKSPKRLAFSNFDCLICRSADRLHQAQLVVGRQVMDRQAALGRVGMLRPAHHGFDEIAVVEFDLEATRRDWQRRDQGLLATGRRH